MNDSRPRHNAGQSPHRTMSSGQANEQRKIDDIVRHVSEAFSSELSSIMKRNKRS